MFRFISNIKKMRQLHKLYEKAFYIKSNGIDPNLAIENANCALTIIRSLSPKSSSILDINGIHGNFLYFKASAGSMISDPFDRNAQQEIIDDFEQGLKMVSYSNHIEAIKSIALICYELSMTYADFPFGNKSENIERAIELAKLAKEHYYTLKDQDFFTCATANLATYYSERINGVRTENIENALRQIEEVEQNWTKETAPIQWAKIQHEKARLLTDTNKNNDINNENAIAACKKALTILTLESEPLEFIMILGDLATFYRKSAKGDLSINLEKAVKSIETAVFHAKELFGGKEIALLLMFKAQIYEVRISGNKIENLNIALLAAQEADDFYKSVHYNGRQSHSSSFIASIMMELNKINHYKNSPKIENKLQEAITLAKMSNETRALIQAMFSLAMYYQSIKPNDYELIISTYSEIANLTNGIDDSSYYSALLNKATSFINRVRGSQAENISIALSLYRKAHNYFEKLGNKKDLILAKKGLAQAYLSVSPTEYKLKEDKSISLLEQAIDLNNNQDDQEYADILYRLGKSYLQKQNGNANLNKFNAISNFGIAIDYLDKEKDIELWVNTIVSLIHSLIFHEKQVAPIVFSILKPEDKDNNNTLYWGSKYLYNYIFDKNKYIRIQKLLDDVFERIDKKNFSKEYCIAKQCQATVYIQLLLSGQDIDPKNIVSTYQEALHAIDRKTHPFDWADAQISLAHYYSTTEDLDRENFPALAEKGYKAALEIITLENWPLRYLSLQIYFAESCVRKEHWEQANIIYSEVFSYIETNLSSNFNFFSNSRSTSFSIYLAPVAAIMVNDLERAILYSEKIRANKLREEISIKNLLDKQINQGHLSHKYQASKLGERVLSMQFGDEKAKTLDFIENNQQKIDINTLPSILESIHLISTWVLIPFIGINSSKYILIPPKGGLQKAIVTEPLPFGNVDLIQLMAKDENGWLETIVEDKKENFEFAEKKISQYLWKVFGSWLFDEIFSQEEINNEVELVLIPQSGLYILPLNSMQNPNTKKHLIDNFAISYVPSLFTLISLQNNADKYNEEDAIAFIPLPEDHDDILEYLPLENALSISVFDKSKKFSLSRKKVTLENTMAVLKQANYWHFATHGSFDWLDSSKSFLVLDKNLYLNLLVSLESQVPLRLVILSACETAMHGFNTNFNEAVGLPSQFLQMGAIGTIATLWEMPDISSLIIGRFYDFHIEEGLKPAIALRSAQLWFRDLTIQKMRDYIIAKRDKGAITHKVADIILNHKSIKHLKPNGQHFKDPRYWASFVLYGC